MGRRRQRGRRHLVANLSQRQAPWPEEMETEMAEELAWDEPFEPPMQISLTAFADEDRCLLGFC